METQKMVGGSAGGERRPWARAGGDGKERCGGFFPNSTDGLLDERGREPRVGRWKGTVKAGWRRGRRSWAEVGRR